MQQEYGYIRIRRRIDMAMRNQLLHIFRNSPMGRENLTQSAYLCEKVFGLSLRVYVPTTPYFVMHFDAGPVTVDLDASYVRYPSTAKEHAEDALTAFKCEYSFFTPTEFEAGNRPVMSAEWAILACPRVISEKSGRIGLGHIGPKVRSLVRHAPFPVFIPSMCFTRWESVTAFFGGSELGTIAVKEGMALARLARVPLTIHTQLDGITREECEGSLSAAGILGDVSSSDIEWQVFDTGDFEENLYAVRQGSLVVVGAAGHRLMAELVFGSKLETIQQTLANPLVVVGPDCRTPWELLPESALG